MIQIIFTWHLPTTTLLCRIPFCILVLLCSYISLVSYASIVTIIIIVELHLIGQLGSKVQRQNLVCSESYP